MAINYEQQVYFIKLLSFFLYGRLLRNVFDVSNYFQHESFDNNGSSSKFIEKKKLWLFILVCDRCIAGNVRAHLMDKKFLERGTELKNYLQEL